jgi:predicted amidohydrolase YtcJ
MASRRDEPAMRLRLALALFAAAAASEFRSPARPSETPPPAQWILTNGAVYTMDAARSWAEAVAIRNGKIVYVGTDAGARAFVGPGTRVLRLAGKMVLPGFHDAHVHPVSGGLELGGCVLSGVQSKEKVFETIREYASANPTRAWITGSGWELPVFPEANPTRQELDALVPDRPACLWAADGHSVWANSRALAIAGVTRETPDPPNGRIERDATGAPSGTLREFAGALVTRHVPKPTAAERSEGLRRALEMARRFGITSLIEADASPEILAAYVEAERAGRLTARVVASLGVDVERGPEQVPDLVRRRDAIRAKRLRASAAKIFADGVIESETAALLSPYLDRPGWSGKPNLDAAAFARLATALDAAGFQIHVHAIGDRAVRMALDAFEAARSANGPRDARPIVAHLELIDPADVPRFRRLGVLADFQPLWAYADSYIRELTIPKLGPERSREIYPIGSIAKSGAALAAGSDWSVSSMNPLEAIQVAVTRRGPDEKAGPAFLPEERVDLPTILAAYTIGGAYAAFEEKETGSLEPGKVADLVVLDRNLFEIPAEEIHSVRVLLTMLEGEEIYRDPSLRF